MGFIISPIVVWFFIIIGCQDGGAQSRLDIFTRASLDLRGYRPSIDEMESVLKTK